jgi:hypothetical protein
MSRDCTNLHWASHTGLWNIFDFYLTHLKADENVRYGTGRTGTRRALATNRTELLQVLNTFSTRFSGDRSQVDRRPGFSYATVCPSQRGFSAKLAKVKAFTQGHFAKFLK